MKISLYVTRPIRFEQWHSLWVAFGHPMAFGWLRYSPFAQKYRADHPQVARRISDAFVQAACGTCLLVSAERHGRMKFPIKSAAGQNASVSRHTRSATC
jgi:hypothetical protein